jgi:uncharacterized protein (DUF2147 family)
MSVIFKQYFRWIIAILLITQFGFSQSVLGKWKTIDDISGKEKGIVEIYERNGVVYARILEIFEAEHRNKKCTLCSGEDKDKPLLGLVIIRGLRKDGDEYTGGKVVDPKIGKYYRCYIKLEEKDKLKVRGYIGVPLLGRTQYWYRVKK